MRLSVTRLAYGLVLLGATSGPGTTAAWAQGNPGDDLEIPEMPAPPQAPASSEPGPPPPPSLEDADLVKALDPGAQAPRPKPAAPAPAPSEAKRPEEPDPLAEARERLRAAQAQLAGLVSKGQWGEVKGAVRGAMPFARAVGPQEELRLWRVAVRAARALKDERGLLAAVNGWLSACGPGGVEACRREGLKALGPRDLPPAARARLKARAESVQRADACLASAEPAARRPGGRPPVCLAVAKTGYARAGDRLMVGRVLLAQALFTKSRPAALEKLKSAEQACLEQRCRALRARILREAIPLFVERHDLRGAARMALAELGRLTGSLPPGLRLYVRTPEVESTCERLEVEEGPGMCHRLERPLLGRYSFHDFSKEQSGQGLSPDVVKRVSQHYEVLVNDCLASEVRSQRVRESGRFLLHWTVQNNGLVQQVHLDRKDAEGSPLAQCLRQAFTYWRYPRYNGELQHVDQEFAVRVSTAR